MLGSPRPHAACWVLALFTLLLAGCPEDAPTPASQDGQPAATAPADIDLGAAPAIDGDLAAAVAAARPPELPPLEVTRQRHMATSKISPHSGGVIDSGNGLKIAFPAGSVDQERTVHIYEAKASPPGFTVKTLDDSDAAVKLHVRTWEVDVGPQEGLLPGEVDVAVDLPRDEAGNPHTHAIATLAADGKRWFRVPADVRDGKLHFRTQHFCLVTVVTWTVGIAAAGSGGMAAGFMIDEPARELPSIYGQDAPFMRLYQQEDPLFDICWSEKMVTEAQRSELRWLRERINKQYLGNPSRGPELLQEVQQAERDLLEPQAVKRIRQALSTAHRYLHQVRGFKQPFCKLPVYVVPKLKASHGKLYNPWTGRRYLILGADATDAQLNNTVLHELFHHHQLAYLWLDRVIYGRAMEASAALLEREAEPWYRDNKIPYESQTVGQFVALRHGIDGPGADEALPMTNHGYAMSWLLEWLRDNQWVRSGRKAEDFHREWLTSWAGNWANPWRRSLLWAADPDERSPVGLGRLWPNFILTQVLSGDPAGQGDDTPFGQKYSGGGTRCLPLQVSPYIPVPAVEFGECKSPMLNLANEPMREVGEDYIKPFSLQPLVLGIKERPLARAVLYVPGDWQPGNGGRRVYIRPKFRGSEAAQSWNSYPGRKDNLLVLDPHDSPVIYFIDCGAGDAWVFKAPPAKVVLLEPPPMVDASFVDDALSVAWSAPHSREFAAANYASFRIYVEGRPDPLAIVPTGQMVHRIPLKQFGSTPPAPGQSVKLWMTSVFADPANAGSTVESPPSPAVTVARPGAAAPPVAGGGKFNLVGKWETRLLGNLYTPERLVMHVEGENDTEAWGWAEVLSYPVDMNANGKYPINGPPKQTDKTWFWMRFERRLKGSALGGYAASGYEPPKLGNDPIDPNDTLIVFRMHVHDKPFYSPDKSWGQDAREGRIKVRTTQTILVEGKNMMSATTQRTWGYMDVVFFKGSAPGDKRRE